MLNVIWLLLIGTAVLFGIIDGKIPEVVQAVTDYAKFAFNIALGLAGIMAFWLGLMNIAEKSGLTGLLARALRPLMKWLFPEVPTEHPAMGAMVLNIAANMLGLANAATPIGIKAMEELQTLNDKKNVASDAMCMFLALNTSSVQLIPVTAIAYLAANGAHEPSSVIASALLATSVSTIVAIIVAKACQRYRWFSSAKW